MRKPKIISFKSKSSLPQWYPLPIYSEKLSDEQWLDQITMRLAVKTAFENTGNKKKSKEQFESLIVNQNYKKESLASKEEEELSSLWGIKELSSFDAAYLSCALDKSNKGSSLKKTLSNARDSNDLHSFFKKDKTEFQDEKNTSFGQLINWDEEPFSLPDILTGLPIIVDLDYDDETLKLMFEVWLSSARNKSDNTKKNISDEYMAQLKEYGVLQTFDLQLWAKLHDAKFTNNVIANAIWPESDVDTTERLRKVTNPKVTAVFDDWGFFRRLVKQIEISHAINNIVTGMKK